MEVFFSRSILHFSAIKVGNLYDAEIIAVREIGLSLRIDGRVVSFCPISLTSDAAPTDLSKLQKKFKVGQVLNNVRVWQTNGSEVIVTHKKSLVELEASKCLLSYADCTVGRQAVGVVQKITSEGVAVHFFNHVRIFNIILFKKVFFKMIFSHLTFIIIFLE